MPSPPRARLGGRASSGARISRAENTETFDSRTRDGRRRDATCVRPVRSRPRHLSLPGDGTASTSCLAERCSERMVSYATPAAEQGFESGATRLYCHSRDYQSSSQLAADTLRAVEESPALVALPTGHVVLSLFTGLARRAAKLSSSHPHRLRHGGASADSLEGISDFTLMDRGHWMSVASIKRYRQPAPYLRQLELLSPQQRSEAVRAELWLKRNLPVSLARLTK